MELKTQNRALNDPRLTSLDDRPKLRTLFPILVESSGVTMYTSTFVSWSIMAFIVFSPFQGLPVPAIRSFMLYNINH